jgi:hypothetical protein
LRSIPTTTTAQEFAETPVVCVTVGASLLPVAVFDTPIGEVVSVPEKTATLDQAASVVPETMLTVHEPVPVEIVQKSRPVVVPSAIAVTGVHVSEQVLFVTDRVSDPSVVIQSTTRSSADRAGTVWV